MQKFNNKLKIASNTIFKDGNIIQQLDLKKKDLLKKCQEQTIKIMNININREKNSTNLEKNK